ncbi:amyloid beta A4 precursor protein-binding family B member 1-interacting protein-like isoform X2 [Genypterus blacodes]|uniref:amyloid beta A4 precursor protein-binding family B member 1-interacting protein-like isoform X2 n=1 Tax=Genypterus blacodes TaxID=154954 RepID=UPI003F75A7F6
MTTHTFMMLPADVETDKMDIDAEFTDLLGEMDLLTQSLDHAVELSEMDPGDGPLSIGFTDLNESLNELEDHDLDALVADLGSKSTTSEESLPVEQQGSDFKDQHNASSQRPEPAAVAESSALQMNEIQTKADKIKLALEKLREAKVRKLIVKVLLSDGSSKTLMVDERQTVREVLDKLFEKTHCDCSVDWSLCETNPALQTARILEDHEYFVESLSAWTRDSENKINFLSRPEKYVLFKDPQVFYMWKNPNTCLQRITDMTKKLVLKESFEGSALIVPDLEGLLYLKEDGKRVWKERYFLLRASGIYYVPKGKTKLCSDLACFVHFEKVNIYTTENYKQKYKAPTNFCFILKHPCIQKDSQHIHFLCCEDEHTLSLWVNSIRVAKYGTVLYHNYQDALKLACASKPSTHPTANQVRSDHRSLQIQQNDDRVSPKTTRDDEDDLPPDFIPLPPGQSQL